MNRRPPHRALCHRDHLGGNFVPADCLAGSHCRQDLGRYLSLASAILAGPVHNREFRQDLHRVSGTAALCLEPLFVGLGCTFLTLSLGGLAGYALSRLAMRRAAALVVGIFAVSMFPPASLLPALFQTFLTLGLQNTYTGLILAHTG